MMMMQIVGPLARIDQAKRLLAEARTVDEIKDIRDKAEAIRQYSKTAGLTIDIQNYAAEIKIRAERKMGVLLRDTPMNPGAAVERGNVALLREPEPTLAEMGLTKMQSHRAQAIAGIPPEVFEEAIAEKKELAAEAIAEGRSDPAAVLTTAGMVRLAKEIQAERDAAVIERVIGSDPKGTVAAASFKYAIACGIQASRELSRLKPEAVAEVISDDDYTSIELLVGGIVKWFEAITAARTQGLRIIR